MLTFELLSHFMYPLCDDFNESKCVMEVGVNTTNINMKFLTAHQPVQLSHQ
jgi:hypothetical protein